MNLTEVCDWSGEEPRVTEQLDTASCNFLSILPHEQVISAFIWIFMLLTIFSLLFNGLSLLGLALVQSEDFSWEPRAAFFMNLILSDVVQTVTFAAGVLSSLVQRRTIEFSIWCHVQYLVGTTCIFSSLLTITCMALERYFYVCHAIHYLVILTQVRLRLALSLIWVYSISSSTITMALLYTGGEQQNGQVTRGLLCEPDMMEQHMGFPRAPAVFRKALGSFTLLLCLFVYAFSYSRMYQDASKATMQFRQVNIVARKTVLFYCGMLFLQLLPLLLKAASDALYEVEGMMTVPTRSHGDRKTSETPSTTAVTLHLSLLALILVPPCINPLVYGLRNPQMRQAQLKLFRRWSRRQEMKRANMRQTRDSRSLCTWHICHREETQVAQ